MWQSDLSMGNVDISEYWQTPNLFYFSLIVSRTGEENYFANILNRRRRPKIKGEVELLHISQAATPVYTDTWGR